MDDHAQAALQAPRPLTPEQMSAFIERGYLVLRGCIPAEPMRRLVDDTLRHKRPMPAYRGRGERAGGPPIEALDLTDPTTWGSPSLYLDTRRSMALADAPILWGALASLVGGEDRLASRSFGQSLILNADHRPPPCPPLTPAYCRDLHWHIDVTSPRTTLFDRRDALVLLVLWSKVEPGGGGTLVCPDSLTRVVHQLEDTKGGVDTTDQRWGGKIIEECADIFEFTGDVGDVLIAHPFTLHASHYNYSRALRAVENPTIMVRRALDYADNPRPSPVESAVLRRRRRTAVKPRRPDPGAGDIAALTSPAARAESSLYRRLQHFLPVPAKPPWLSLVNDQVPLHMRARRVRGILRLWMVTADGIQRVVDVEATSAGIRRRVAKRGSPWIRSDPQLAGRWGPHLVAFSERVAWAQRAVRGEDIATKHRPSTREAALASLARSLRERSEPSASALATAEGALPWLRAYLAIARAEWSTLRSLSDEARGALPSWLETLVLAVSGDVRGLASWTHADPAEGAHTDSLSVLEGLALAEIQWVDRAYERMLAGLRHLAPYERAHFYVPLAKLAAARGDEDEAAHYLLAALQCRADDERLLTRISGELLRLGDFTRAAELLRARADREPQSPAVFETLAALASWCGQVDEARAWAERALRDEPARVGARRVLAICDALSGDDERALEQLLALDTPEGGDPEIKTWIAELLLRRGDRTRAASYLGHAAAQSRTVAHALLQLLVDGALVHPDKVAYAESLGLRPPTSAEHLVAMIHAQLRRLHGNRTTTLTRMPSAEAGRPEQLSRVRAGDENVRKVSRDAAADLLKSVRYREPERLHRDFAALTERFPESPHPWCYWGELRLWFGELTEADACFRHPIAEDARWAFVGRAAVHLQRGEFAQAHAELEAVGREYRPLPGATTHVYAGELYRQQGEPTRALQELTTAIDAKPGRLGARINRVLCMVTLGREQEARSEAHKLQERFPWIFWEAARTLGLPWPAPADQLVALMDATLRLMRGNRSSHTHTYFDARGRLRTLGDAHAWAKFADEHRTLVERELERRLLT